MNSHDFRVYVAGLFDWEGSIMIYEKSYLFKGKANCMQKYFCIAQSGDRGKEVLELIQTRLGYGNITSSVKGRYLRCYWWGSREYKIMKKFLEFIKPYAIIKKEEVEEALCYVNKRLKSRYDFRWTLEEDEILLNNYHLPKGKLVKILNRTYYSIVGRKHTMKHLLKNKNI